MQKSICATIGRRRTPLRLRKQGFQTAARPHVAQVNPVRTQLTEQRKRHMLCAPPQHNNRKPRLLRHTRRHSLCHRYRELICRQPERIHLVRTPQPGRHLLKRGRWSGRPLAPQQRTIHGQRIESAQQRDSPGTLQLPQVRHLARQPAALCRHLPIESAQFPQQHNQVRKRKFAKQRQIPNGQPTTFRRIARQVSGL